MEYKTNYKMFLIQMQTSLSKKEMLLNLEGQKDFMLVSNLKKQVGMGRLIGFYMYTS